MTFQFHLPDIGEGVIEGEVVRWIAKEGQVVALDEPIVEIMTDKATVEIPSPRAGTISKINFEEGQVCPVGDVLLEIEVAGGSQAEAPAKSHQSSSTTVTAPVPVPTGKPQFVDATASRGRVLATPAVRRLARQQGIDLSGITGTGRNGRITKEDLASGGSQAVAAAPARASYTPMAIPEGGLEERVPFRGVRKVISDNMERSAFTATHFTYVEEVDMTELVALRTRAKARAAEAGVKLTYLPFIVKAITSGLKKWGALNASLDEVKQEIVRKKYYHMGIAAQGPQGLVVTVVKDADKRSIYDLSREIARLAQSVQDGSIRRDELTGSTFTISSLGKIGGVLATPIINFPEVGIVGVHKMEQKPAVRDGEICIRWLMNLSISLDHRLVDGWDGAMFLQDVKALLEDPTSMFMEMV